MDTVNKSKKIRYALILVEDNIINIGTVTKTWHALICTLYNEKKQDEKSA